MQSFNRYIYLSIAMFMVMFSSAWVLAINARQYFTLSHAGIYAAKFEMLRKCDIGKIIVLGDSRAGSAYDPAVLGNSVRNFAFTGHSPIEGYYFAKKLLACPNKPDAVILAYSPKELSELQWFWSVGAQSGILDLAALNEISDKARELGDHEIYKQQFGAELPPRVKNWTYIHHLPVYDFPTLMAVKYKLNGQIYNQNAVLYQQLLTDNGYIIFPMVNPCVKGLAPESGPTRLETNKVIDYYYRKLVDLLEEQHIRTIIAPIPYSEKSAAAVTPEFKVDLNRYQRSVAGGKKYVSFHGELFIGVNNCQFVDDLHVSRQGAAVFSERMKQDILPQFADPDPLAKGASK